MGAASCDPSDRRRLIHAPADSGRPQPLEDSPRGYEDFTRESTGSDVFSQSAPHGYPNTIIVAVRPAGAAAKGPRLTRVEALP